MLCDTMGYDPLGTILNNHINKAIPIVTIPVVVSAMGASLFNREFASAIAASFRSFDDLVTNGEAFLSHLFLDLADEHFDGDADTTLFMIGWLEEEDRPASLFMDLWTDTSSGHQKMMMRNTELSELFSRAAQTRGKFQHAALGEIKGSPIYGTKDLQAAGFVARSGDDYKPEIDLLHLAEIARHHLHPDGTSRVGGQAILSTISSSGIQQRVVHRWHEDDDLVGDILTPKPINWTGWRERKLLASSHIKPETLSRLQRERMEKKARKGTLR